MNVSSHVRLRRRPGARLSEILRQLAAIAGHGRRDDTYDGPQWFKRADAPLPGHPGARIDALYGEMRELLALSPDDPARRKVDDVLVQLRRLQSEEADCMRERYISGLRLAPGAGLRALREARDLLADHEDPAAENRSLDEPD